MTLGLLIFGGTHGNTLSTQRMVPARQGPTTMAAPFRVLGLDFAGEWDLAEMEHQVKTLAAIPENGQSRQPPGWGLLKPWGY